MEAIASASSWIPEDDLLLKNSIEAGASLEALAKGAVNFSRKFSFQELQQRWHSLLYDPDISAEVSTRMTEYELSIPKQLLKSNTSGNSKEILKASRKRKFGSIRSLYYALQKKMCREYDISTDLSCISASNAYDGISNIGDYPQHVISNNDHPVGSRMLKHPMASQLQLPEASSDITHHPLPEKSRDFSVANVLNDTANAKPSVQDNSANGQFGKDGLLEFREAISPQPLPAQERNECIIKHSLDEINTQKEFSYMNEEKLAELGNFLGIEELGHSQTGEHQSLSKTTSEAIPPPAFGSMNANVGNASSGYGGTEQIDSPASDGMPLSKTIEDVSTLAAPNASIEDKVQDVEGALGPSGHDNDSKNLSEHSSIHPRSMLEDTNNDVLEGTMAMPQGDFVGLPDSLLNTENSKELNEGWNDKLNEPSLDNCNSRLLCSKEVHEVEIPSFEHATSVSPVSNTCFNVPGGACPVKREYPAGASHPISSNQNRSYQSEASVPQVSLMSMTHSSELHECMLNSEDPDIPENDDIAFLTEVAMPFTFIKSNCKEAIEHPQSFMNKRDYSDQYLRASNPFSDIDTEFNHSNIGLGVVSKHTDNGIVPSNCSKAQPTLDCPRHGGLEITKFNFEKMNATATFRENHIFHAEQTSVNKTFTEQGMTRDQEEYESDDDIPYFSDIEAMILDMDLGPCDPDPGISEKVSRYQTEDAKRRIMRLEQCAHSCLIRSITSQGAFAILYGRHLKHYIKKTEVILGRATDDFDVDIDLGREGRANKISRRQAIITLKENGSFLLKNLGKNSIFVNGKEVSTGQLLVLTSSCLIEIRDMSFIFEVNHKFVKQHIVNLHKKSQHKNIKFEWMPEGGP